ncbi:hypothetical protein [Candidatus Palauibacter sp.]|uniref:hypothetical protein n=1 Tax=Candidatus Palauibacter sp. TaxID=3101350 RepID=UPI003B590A2C
MIRRDTELVYRVGVDLSGQAEAERALRAELETSGEVSCGWSQPGQSHVVVVSYNGVVRQDLTIDPEDPRYQTQSASRESDGARHETAQSVTGVEIGRASSPDATYGQRNRIQYHEGGGNG